MTTLQSIIVCFVSTAICFSLIIRDTLSLTQLKMDVPEIEQEVKTIEGEIDRLNVEITAFKSPINLIQLLKKPTYSHLSQPFEEDVIILHPHS